MDAFSLSSLVLSIQTSSFFSFSLTVAISSDDWHIKQVDLYTRVGQNRQTRRPTNWWDLAKRYVAQTSNCANLNMGAIVLKDKSGVPMTCKGRRGVTGFTLTALP